MMDDDTLPERFLDELTSPDEGVPLDAPEGELRDFRLIWEDLARLPEVDVPPRARRRARAAAMAELRSGRGRSAGHRALAAAAVAVLVFLGGYVAGGRGGAVQAVVDDEPRYVLLIRGGMPPEQEARVAERMADWAEALRSDGRLVRAERLREAEARWIGTAPEPDRREPVVGGYFVIRAADTEEAVEIARGSPHLGLGGDVAVEVVPVAR